MIATLRAYLLELIAASVLISAVSALLPGGAVRKILLFAGGIVVFLVAVRPLPQIDWDRVTEMLSFPVAQPVYGSDALDAVNDALRQQYIKEQCEAYILDKAAQSGIALKGAFVSLGGDEAAMPVAVTVRGAFTKQQRERLSAMIEQSLGIQTENQVWIWE